MVARSVSPPLPRALPRHVAIIMDGNGRWAEQQGKPRIAGHRDGIEPVREAVRASGELGVEVLTLFAFSSENFDRPADEVGGLMALFLDALDREIAELDANGVRLRFVGNRHELGPGLVEATRAAEARTAKNAGLNLVIAVAYGGRWDLTQAARRLAELARDGDLDPADIDEATFGRALATAELPAVDLLIRTGGEQRVSNFLLWQLAYSELYFSGCLWPEFDRAELGRALEFYASRERRFGRTGRQIGTGAC
jgi:undecaprenyl diphosphate synthase